MAIPAEMIHYGMTKTSLLAVSRGFAKDAAGTGVTVNSVLAGPTHTGASRASSASSSATRCPGTSRSTRSW